MFLTLADASHIVIFVMFVIKDFLFFYNLLVYTHVLYKWSVWLSQLIVDSLIVALFTKLNLATMILTRSKVQVSCME